MHTQLHDLTDPEISPGPWLAGVDSVRSNVHRYDDAQMRQHACLYLLFPSAFTRHDWKILTMSGSTPTMWTILCLAFHPQEIN